MVIKPLDDGTHCIRSVFTNMGLCSWWHLFTASQCVLKRGALLTFSSMSNRLPPDMTSPAASGHHLSKFEKRPEMPHPTALFAINQMQCQRRLQISRVKNIGNGFRPPML